MAEPKFKVGDKIYFVRFWNDNIAQYVPPSMVPDRIKEKHALVNKIPLTITSVRKASYFNVDDYIYKVKEYPDPCFFEREFELARVTNWKEIVA